MLKLELTQKSYEMHERLVHGIHTGLHSPVNDIYTIHDDVLDNLGLSRRFKTTRRPSPKKCVVKKPLFNVYMRMKNDD